VRPISYDTTTPGALHEHGGTPATPAESSDDQTLQEMERKVKEAEDKLERLRNQVGTSLSFIESGMRYLKEQISIFFNGDRSKIEMKSEHELKLERNRASALLSFMKSNDEKKRSKVQADQLNFEAKLSEQIGIYQKCIKQ
jgi:malonyl CoA-acyl carrier protein transacylase